MRYTTSSTFKRVIALAALAAGIASAQQNPSAQQSGRPSPGPDPGISEQRAAISRLDFMLGTWTGAGWIMFGPSQRADFTQTEIVVGKLDGTLLTIDGDGRNKDGRPVHNAFAVFTYNPETKQYRFQPYLPGHQLDVTPTVTDHGWNWAFDAPYGKTRFTLDFTNGIWHETGEFSRDGGQTWAKNFEMTLTKAK